MMTAREKGMLYWLARNIYAGEGVIVDAGLFLGASTNAFAKGIRENDNTGGKARDFKAINSYDTAIWVQSMNRHVKAQAVRRALGGRSLRKGQSFLPILRKLLAPHLDLIDFRIGDIVETATADRPIEIAFFDCLKTAERDAAAFKAFAPWYVPGKTIIVQQDYFYELAPDLKIRQEYLSPYFSYLGSEATSAAFRLERALPKSYFLEDPIAELSLGDKIALLERAADRCNDIKFRLYARLAVVQYLADAGYRNRADNHLKDALDELRGSGASPRDFGERMLTLVSTLSGSR